MALQELMSARPDEWGIITLQNGILNVAKYLNDFCEENGIDYCLMGGSALGAIRHKGFIPWDDDLDVFMRPEEYHKFRKLFFAKGDIENFYIQEWGACDNRISYAKFRMNNSAFVEEDVKDWDIHHGVFVDIFILHTCPDSKIQRYNQFVWAKYILAKSASNRGYVHKKQLINVIFKLLKVLPPKFLFNFALKQLYKYDCQESEFFCHFMGRAGIKTGIYKRSYFSSTKLVPFETIELRVPYLVEKYLEDRWGDYMKLPSKEEISRFQHRKSWSVDIPFANYNEDGKYLDEKYL